MCLFLYFPKKFLDIFLTKPHGADGMRIKRPVPRFRINSVLDKDPAQILRSRMCLPAQDYVSCIPGIYNDEFLLEH